VGEVHDDVSGLPPDDDDLLSSPRGWDDEDDGLDALIPRRTGQTEAIRPDAPPPAAESDLPPWTEPGTGEVPASMRGDEDDLDAWSGISNAPRWRDQASEEWESDDFEDLADDDQTQLGGFDDDLEEDEVVVFDDVASAPPIGHEPAGHREPFPSDPRRGGLLGVGGPPPQEPGSDARDLPVAVGVGVGLAVAFLVLMAIRPGAAMLLIVPALVLAAAEFYTAVRKAGYAPVNLLGMVAVAGLALGTFWRGEPAMPLVLFLTVVAGMLWYLFNPGERVVPNLGITFLGVLWIGLLGSFAALMLTIPQQGTGVLTGAILVTVAHDIVGLVVGSRMGRSPLSAASPGKTMEGTIGGVAAAIVTGLIVGLVLEPWSPVTGIQLGIAAAIMAPLGDLAESVLKRDLGIKDMGSILPGHGGLLDRFDALLFVLPAAYYVVVLNDFLF
jgi:phosphatidate cytidylyltransferase